MKLIVLSALCISLISADSVQETAAKCSSKKCAIADNCRCSSTANPLSSGVSPQFLTLTFSEAVVASYVDNYWSHMLYDRVNPDGNPVTATFYVPHEYTDYTKVQELYLQGMEIGVHSVTKNPLQSYWRNASLDVLEHEFGDQREIITNFANIPKEDIVGARTPQLQIEGDVTINALINAGLIYDNSWPTLSTRRLYPYTLDYESTQDCTVTIECPVESHPGFWILPITDIVGNNSECNSLATCNVQGSADYIANWLLEQLNNARNSNRAPLDLRVDTYWFSFTENSYDGLNKFLDEVAKLEDVFIVSQAEVLKWMKKPVDYKNYQTTDIDRDAECNAVNCKLTNVDGEIRYMKSCVPCPAEYPWLYNPLGQKNSTAI